MKKKVFLITSNRSDYGIQKNLIKILSKEKSFKFGLVVTGTHLNKRYGFTIKEILKDKFKIFKKIQLNSEKYLLSDTLNIFSKGISKFFNLYQKNKPDLIIILGDRYEMLSAALPSIFLKIPVAHIHGGEKTIGSFDDKFRNILTEISNLHFTCHDIYKRRVIQIKNTSSNVYNYGSLSVENIKNLKFENKKKIVKKYKIKLNKKKIIVTYHPETKKIKYTIKDFKNILKAISIYKETNFFFTSPAPDPENYKIIFLIKKFCKENKNCFFIKSLGREYYFSLLNNVDAVLGNSSSGIIEVPSFGIPTINIGNRQRGRLQARSIINCKNNKKEIINSINNVYSYNLNFKLKKNQNIFYKKNTAKNIASTIKKYLNF